MQPGTGTRDRDQSVSVNHTYNFSAALLNSFIFSFNRIHGTILSGAPFSFPSIGIPIAASTPPEMALTVTGYFSIGTGHPGHFDRQNFHFADSVHWIKGQHEISIGGDLMKMQVDLINTFRQNGNFRFRGTELQRRSEVRFHVGRGRPVHSGRRRISPAAGARSAVSSCRTITASTSRLVLNLGLRWDPFHPYGDIAGRTECYRPGLISQRFPNAPPGYLFEGDPGCPSGGSDAVYWQFAPRLGLAYNIGGNGKTVFASGFGVFYQPPFVEAYNNMVDSAPWSPQVQIFGVPFDNPYKAYPNPFPAQYAPFIPPSNVAFITPPSLAVSYTPDWKPGRDDELEFHGRAPVGKDLLIRAGYAAFEGHAPGL